MTHYNTVFNQLTKIVGRHDFDALAKKHDHGQNLRAFDSWSQFNAMAFAHLTGRTSLRDIEHNMKSQQHKLYHIGVKNVKRATLSRVNENEPCALYESLFNELLTRCQNHSPKNPFNFKEKLYLLDTTTIDLCLAAFPWADFRTTKGAVKIHTGLDTDGYLPTFISIAEGKTHELNWAKTLKFPKGSFIVFDRGFTDYQWYQTLTDSGIFFVTRLKSNAVIENLEKRKGRKSCGILEDRTIKLKDMESNLRMVHYIDYETEHEYKFLTNATHLSGKIIADLYKERWQIELFFKWIKQNLKVKTFLGTSRNAVMTQLWIALCMYLILAYLKFVSKIELSMQHMLKLLQINLLERTDMLSLFKPPDKSKSGHGFKQSFLF